MAAQALAAGDCEQFSLAVFRDLWTGATDPKQDDWLAGIIARHDLPADWAKPRDREHLLTAVEENTAAAYRAGAFGVPSFVLRGIGRAQLFWGVDRMDFLARALDKLGGTA